MVILICNAAAEYAGLPISSTATAAILAQHGGQLNPPALENEKGINAQSSEDLLAAAQECVEKGFADKEDHYMRGKVGRQYFAEARRYFKDAERANKENSTRLLLKYGWFTYWTSGGMEEKNAASDMLRKALKMAPDNPESCYKVARIILDEQSSDAAISSGMEPKHPQSDAAAEDAARLLQKAIRLQPDFADAYWLLGYKIYFHNHDTAKTKHCYAEFLRHREKINPELNLYNSQRIEAMINCASIFLEQQSRGR